MNASLRGKAANRKGKTTERDVANYLRTVGWPNAGRSRTTGYRTSTREEADKGDVKGTPGLAWQVKSSPTEQLAKWMAEAEDQAVAAGADYGVLVHRRAGKSDPARWWAWITVGDLVSLAGGSMRMYEGASAREPVRMELGHLVPLLIAAGYGTSEEAAA